MCVCVCGGGVGVGVCVKCQESDTHTDNCFLFQFYNSFHKQWWKVAKYIYSSTVLWLTFLALFYKTNTFSL